MVINTLSLNFHNANKGFGSWGQNLKAKSKHFNSREICQINIYSYSKNKLQIMKNYFCKPSFIFNEHYKISLKAKQHIRLLCNSLCFISIKL